MGSRRNLALLAVLVALAGFVVWIARDAPGSSSREESGAEPAEPPPAERVALNQGATPTAQPSSTDAKPVEDTPATGAKPPRPGAPTFTGPGAGAMRGRVVDASGKPVQAARVLALHAPELGAPHAAERAFAGHRPLDAPLPEQLFSDVPYETASDALGAFAFERLPPGRLRFAVVHAEAGRHERDDLLVVPTRVLELGELGLVHGARAWVRPTSLVEDKDRPLAGGVLYARNTFADARTPTLAPEASVELARANASGLIVTPPLARGSHEFLLCVPGRLPLELGFDVGASAEAHVARPRKGVQSCVSLSAVAPDHAPRLVRALPIGSPDSLVPFELRADACTARVDPETNLAVLDRLDPLARYELRSATDRQAWSERSPWNPPLLVRGDEPFVELLFQPDAGVTGSVRTSKQGGVLDGVVLQLAGAAPTGPHALAELLPVPKVAGEVAFRFDGVRPLVAGALPVLVARGPDYAWAHRELALAPGETLALEPLVLPAAPRVVFTVRDRSGKKPVAGARVHCRPLELLERFDEADAPSGTTDARGRVDVATWGLANTIVRVEADGFAPLERGFDPKLSDAPNVELELWRGTLVRVRVVDQDGAPLAGVRVERRDGPWSPDARGKDDDVDPERARRGAWDLERRADGLRAAWSGPEGIATFPRVAPGQHAFFVERHAPLLEGEWTSREVPDGVALDIPLASVRRVECSGRVVRGERAHAHAELALCAVGDGRDLREPESALPPGLRTRTDARGRFTFANVSPGHYRLVVRVPGQRWRFVQTIALAHDAKPFVIDLEPFSIAGAVLDAEHRLVPDGTIEIARPAHGPELALQFAALALGVPASVRFDLGGWGTLADIREPGVFFIAGALPGEILRLRARRGEHEASTVTELQIPDDGLRGARLSLELVLERRGALELELGGDVSDEDAYVLAIPADLVAGTATDVRTLTTRIAAGASALLAGLAPGDWRLLTVPASAYDAATREHEEELRRLLANPDPEVLRQLREAAASGAMNALQSVTVARGETLRVELQRP